MEMDSEEEVPTELLVGSFLYHGLCRIHVKNVDVICPYPHTACLGLVRLFEVLNQHVFALWKQSPIRFSHVQ